MDEGKASLPPTVAIQQITPDQWRDYEYLRHDMLKNDPSAFPPQAFTDLSAPEKKWRDAISTDIILVAYDGIAPVGMVRASFRDDTAICGNIYTKSLHRGIGLGNKLLEALFANIEGGRKARAIELDVEDTHEDTIKSYEKLGFMEIKRKEEERVIDQEQKKVHVITMRKPL